jgi:hypothetical protein
MIPDAIAGSAPAEVDLRVSRHATSRVVQQRTRTRGGRIVAGVAVGVVVAAVIAAGRLTDHLGGAVGLALGVFLVMAVPTSRQLARRIVYAGVLLLGWVPILWWLALPVGSVGRVTLLLALLGGGLAGSVVGAVSLKARLRSFAPEVRWADALPVGAVFGGAWWWAPWLQLDSARHALAVLMSGWDNSAHYDMTEMIRRHGAAVWATPPPTGGSAWSYVHYPQGYHTFTAAVMELVSSASVGDPSQEIALYVRSLALVSVGAVVMVVAGIAALPSLRRNPKIASIVAIAVTAAFFWGPAGSILTDGFPNFFLACALLAAIPLVAAPVARWSAPLPIAVLFGALMAVAHSWALLLTMAVPVALVVLLPVRRRRATASPGRWVAIGLVAGVTFASVLVAVAVIRVQPLAQVVVYGGGVSARGIRELVVLIFAAVIAAIGLALAAGRPRPPDVTRTVWLVAGPLAGAAFSVWIARVQLAHGGLAYYFWKYAIAVELLSVVVAAVAAGVAVARSRFVGGSRTGPFAFGVVAIAFVAFVCGVPGSIPRDWHLVHEAAGWAARTEVARLAESQMTEPSRLVAAATVSAAQQQPSVYLPIEPDGLHNPASTAQWQAALSGRWIDSANDPVGMLLTGDLSAQGAPRLARDMLRKYPDIVVVVPPDHVVAVRAAVDVADVDRVLTW